MGTKTGKFDSGSGPKGGGKGEGAVVYGPITPAGNTPGDIPGLASLEAVPSGCNVKLTPLDDGGHKQWRGKRGQISKGSHRGKGY